MASTDAQETFEAAHAQDDESLVLAFLRRAEWSATTRGAYGEHAVLALTLTDKVTSEELTAIQRLLRGY